MAGIRKARKPGDPIPTKRDRILTTITIDKKVLGETKERLKSIRIAWTNAGKALPGGYWRKKKDKPISVSELVERLLRDFEQHFQAIDEGRRPPRIGREIRYPRRDEYPPGEAPPGID